METADVAFLYELLHAAQYLEADILVQKISDRLVRDFRHLVSSFEDLTDEIVQNICELLPAMDLCSAETILQQERRELDVRAGRIR